MNVLEIISGWANWTLDQLNILNPETKERAEKRWKKCEGCPIREEGMCSKHKLGEVERDFVYKGKDRKKGEIVNGCQCPLSKKLLSTNTKCPIGAWEEL